MKEYGYEKFTQEWNKKTVDIALKAAALTDREIAVAGSVSTSGSWDKLTKFYPFFFRTFTPCD